MSAMEYAVGGADWDGTLAAFGKAWGAELPPVPKLLLIAYASSPTTRGPMQPTGQGIPLDEAELMTVRLVEAGWIDERPPPQPAAPSLTQLREIVFQRDEYRCRHCGATENLSLDHIHPRSAGGLDDLANLQTLCRSCNSRKGARLESPA